MTDYSKWKTLPVKVTGLELDPRNPRIPAGTEIRSTRDLIAELVEHDEVLDLARSISEGGYFPHESLIGLEEGGKKIILEGNRRLAALKLLINPDAAPEEFKKRFRSLAESAKHPVETIPVVFAPNRKSAARLIAARHTISQVSKWLPIQQARYFRNLVKAGMTVAEVSLEVGRTVAEIAEFLRLDLMYSVACSLDGLRESVRAKVHDPRKFAASNIERLLDTPSVREWLGIEFDKDGNLIGKIDSGEFKKGFRRLVSDVADGTFDSRKYNKAETIGTYVSSIKDDVPNRKKKGSFTALDLLKGETTIVASSPTPRTKPSRAKKSRSIVPKGFKCYVEDERIQEVFDELRRLWLDRHVNSAAVMFRVLLEMSIGYYLDKSSKIKPLLEKLKKEGKKSDHYPTLKVLLQAVIEDGEATKDMDTLAKKNLNKIISDKSHIFTVDLLDSFVHNRFSMPTDRELRVLWACVEDLLKVTLREYAPPAPPPAPK